MIGSFMNWRMFSGEDSLEGNDRLHNKFLDIYVLHPRTHIKGRKALYTDYEIHVKTNHPEFAIKDSKVRRRYSEFAWLRERLGMNDVMMVTAPSLPGKRYFGRFKDTFLRRRQIGLQNFMNKVVEVNAFLSDPALHFFLQSELPVQEMEYYLRHSEHLSNIRDKVIQIQKLRDKQEMHSIDVTKPMGKLRRVNSDGQIDAKGVATPTVNSLPISRRSSSGRGWSQYLAFGVHSNGRHGCACAESARVLPGGQLCLAERDSIDGSNQSTPSNCPHVTTETMTAPRKRPDRPSSWHGATGDLVDLMLSEYDVIAKDVCADLLRYESDIESMSLSLASGFDNSASLGSSSSDSSYDAGIEVDFQRKLQEYNVITSTGGGDGSAHDYEMITSFSYDEQDPERHDSLIDIAESDRHNPPSSRDHHVTEAADDLDEMLRGGKFPLRHLTKSSDLALAPHSMFARHSGVMTLNSGGFVHSDEDSN